MVSFFSKKVKEKVDLVRELSLRASAKDYGKHNMPKSPQPLGLKNDVSVTESELDDTKVSKPPLIFRSSPLEAYYSVRSMVEAELKAGLVNFSWRTDSGCRTLLRLHRSMLWLKLMLEGLAEEPGADGRYKTPGELSRWGTCRAAFSETTSIFHHAISYFRTDILIVAPVNDWRSLTRRIFLPQGCLHGGVGSPPPLDAPPSRRAGLPRPPR